MLQTLANQTAPELIDASEDCMLTVWQERYPDRWLLVEVTGEDDGDPLTGRLLAVAATDMAWCHCGKHIPSKGKSRPSCTGARRKLARRSWREMPRLWVAFPSNSLPVVWARLAQHRFRVVEVIGVGMGQMELPPFGPGY